MKLYGVILALVVAVVVSGCAQYGNQPATSAETTAPTPAQTTPKGEVKEFDITARQWEFVPSTITVNQGDKVKLHIKSIDVTHGFGLPDFGVNVNLVPGKDVHVEFVADKKGTFQFACTVNCGLGHSGMKGQLIVK